MRTSDLYVEDLRRAKIVPQISVEQLAEWFGNIQGDECDECRGFGEVQCECWHGHDVYHECESCDGAGIATEFDLRLIPAGWQFGLFDDGERMYWALSEHNHAALVSTGMIEGAKKLARPKEVAA